MCNLKLHRKSVQDMQAARQVGLEGGRRETPLSGKKHIFIFPAGKREVGANAQLCTCTYVYVCVCAHGNDKLSPQGTCGVYVIVIAYLCKCIC